MCGFAEKLEVEHLIFSTIFAFVSDFTHFYFFWLILEKACIIMQKDLELTGFLAFNWAIISMWTSHFLRIASTGSNRIFFKRIRFD